MRALDVISLVAIGATVLSVPTVLFSIPYLISGSPKAPRVVSIGLIVFVVSLAVGMAASSTSSEIGHREVLRKLAAVDSQSQMLINGQAVRNTNEILAVLRTIDWLQPHHSNPTKRVIVELSDHAPRLVLELARDSGDPREYWVFWPKYHVTKNNEIGRIKTPLFDAY